MELGLKINHLADGRCSVTWTEDNYVQDDQTRLGLMYLLFDEMKLDRATFGVLLNGGDIDPYTVYSIEWWSRTEESSPRSVLSNFVLGGIFFDTEELAEQFKDMLHKLYFLAILKKGM